MRLSPDCSEFFNEKCHVVQIDAFIQSGLGTWEEIGDWSYTDELEWRGTSHLDASWWQIVSYEAG
jgi:hypothetical protein